MEPQGVLVVMVDQAVAVLVITATRLLEQVVRLYLDKEMLVEVDLHQDIHG
jgi:hypothetical protein